MEYRYTKAILQDIFHRALDVFNERMDSAITTENTVLTIFTPANGIGVYESFCKQYFPKYLTENYRQEGYFESFAAQAFVDGEQNGILFRVDIDFTLSDVFYTFLHEISHIFCVRNEINGKNFFNEYCMGSGVEDGMMNAGYAIWREAIADIMASAVASEVTVTRLSSLKRKVTALYNDISVSNSDSKKCMSLILVYIMNAVEVAGTEDWEQAEKAIKKVFHFHPSMMFIFELVFLNLHEAPYWSISPEFIITLGEAYLSLLSFRVMEEQFS